MDEKNFALHQSLMASFAAAAAAAAAASANNGQQQIQQAQQQQQQALLNAQYIAMLQQTNDTVNLTQNALASGVPTLHVPTIISYLGYANTFPGSSNNNSNSNNNNGNGSKETNNTLETKYVKLQEVIQEIGRDVKPLYTGSKTASDRLRRQINQARHLVRECLIEVDKAQSRTS